MPGAVVAGRCKECLAAATQGHQANFWSFVMSLFVFFAIVPRSKTAWGQDEKVLVSLLVMA